MVGPVPLVQDLHITHERFGISSDPSINGHLHYPNDLDRPLNGVPVDKTRQYHTDYNNRVISFMTVITSTSGRFHSEFVSLLFLILIGKMTTFFQLQKFSFRNLPVASSTAVVWRSPHSSNQSGQQDCSITDNS